MRERCEIRLRELLAELEKGQQRLVRLEAEEGELRASLWRITGAIQVLEEFLAQPAAVALEG